MQVVRRVYLYGISFISLMIVLTAASNLLRLLGELFLGATPDALSDYNSSYRRDQFSLWGALLLVGGIVWAIHWLLAQRGVAPTNPHAAEERQSVLRKLFIYGVLITALGQVAFAVHEEIRVLLRLFPTPDSREVGAGLNLILSQGLVYGLAGLYYWWVRRQDHAATPEQGRAATVRRWYVYLVSYVTLTIVMIQTADLARYAWQAITATTRPWFGDSRWVPAPVASALASIVVAGTIWFWHWRTAQRQTAGDPAEQRSVLRKVYLYGMTLQTVGVTLANLSFFLYNLFRALWGSNPVAGSGDSLLTAAGGPVLTALVFGAFWAYHWQAIQADAGLPAVAGRATAAIRQIYHYLVALIGLSMLAGGVADLLRLLFDGLLGGRATTTLSQQAWGDQISLVVTLILVGAPVWVIHWRRVQREALAPDSDAARQALPRRLYLFLILFATVITLLSSAAALLYQLLRNLGTPATAWISDMTWALAATLTAGVLLAYHVGILAGDLRARTGTPGGEPAPIQPPATILLLLHNDSAAALDSAVAAFRSSLPEGIQVESFPAPGLAPAAIRAWLAEQTPAAPQPAPPPAPLPTPPPAPAPLSA